MLYLVGLGLGDATDISVRGLAIVRRAARVYLEAYTSVLTVGKEALEEFYGREVILADRDLVEQNTDVILSGADESDVVFLVVGDPLGATTHTDLLLRAVERGVGYRVLHNASIINAIGCCGLQLYHFGETVSIPFWTDTWKPDSFLDRIEGNLQRGLHTLCLLDIKVKEQSIENMMRGRKVFEPPRFMTIAQAAGQLLEAIEGRRKEGKPLQCTTPDSRCVGVARVGSESQTIAHASLDRIHMYDFGAPLHSLVVVGHTHPLEDKMLSLITNATVAEDSGGSGENTQSPLN